MKNRGFTLVELLAVIVILAVIALIAVPQVLNMIEKARIGSAEDSAYSYVKAVENTLIANYINGQDYTAGKYKVGDIDVKVKGSSPTLGTYILDDKNAVIEAKLCINNYSIYYDGKIASNKKDENYCVDIRPVSFETDSWDTIIKAFRDNDYPYKVGDTRSIDLGTLGNHKLRIANTSECVNNEKSETACGIVLEFEDIILNRSMNTTWENKGGWASSNTRDYVNNEVYNSLEEDLKKIIIDTKVISSHGSIDSKNFESTDKLYLFSCQEVYGTSYTRPDDSSNGTSRQLDYYKNKGVTTSTNTGVAAKKYNGSSTIYWLRSATSYASGSFLTINGGSIVTYIPSESHGVSPAFRIG